MRRSTKVDDSTRKVNCPTYYGSSKVENVLIGDIDRVTINFTAAVFRW